MPKYGQVREDGYRFRSFQRVGDKRYEQWVSPAVWTKRKVAQAAWNVVARRDPIRRAKSVIATVRSQQKRKRDRPHEVMWLRAKTRARRRGLPFDIEPGDLTLPECCPILGIPLFMSTTGQATDNSPEPDRIVNTLGYVKGNVIVISRRANRIKNDATAEELQRIASFYITQSAPAKVKL